MSLGRCAAMDLGLDDRDDGPSHRLGLSRTLLPQWISVWTTETTGRTRERSRRSVAAAMDLGLDDRDDSVILAARARG